jgi:hypothetical protein
MLNKKREKRERMQRCEERYIKKNNFNALILKHITLNKIFSDQGSCYPGADPQVVYTLRNPQGEQIPI